MMERLNKKASERRATTKKVSEGYLERAALHYLGRFSSTEANLKQVLERKVRHRNLENSPATDEQLKWIESVAAKCVRLGYVDDAVYAEQRFNGLLRKGKPLRSIAQDLRHKGVSSDIIEAILSSAQDNGEPDVTAAAAYARRRRFGPFRRAVQDVDAKLEKEKAAMMRAGFSYGLVQKILSSTEDDLINLLP